MLPHLLPICHSVMGFLSWTRGVLFYKAGSCHRKICILLCSDVIYSMYLGKVYNTILDPPKSPWDYSSVSLLLPLFSSQFLPFFRFLQKHGLIFSCSAECLLLLHWGKNLSQDHLPSPSPEIRALPWTSDHLLPHLVFCGALISRGLHTSFFQRNHHWTLLLLFQPGN